MENDSGSPMLAILGILSAIWLLVLVGTVLIFHFIIPLSLFHSFFLNSIVKALLSGILVLIWLGVFIGLTNAFVRNYIVQKPIESSQ